MKKVLLIVLCLVLVLSFVSCSKEATIVGSWYEEGTDLRIKFKDDNTCEFFGQSVAYRVEEDSLIMTVDGQDQVMNFLIEGDNLELIFDEGEDFSIHLQRIITE